MRIIGTTYIYPESYVNGKQAKDMTEEERVEFEKKWIAHHGGTVVWMNKKSEYEKDS